MNKKEISEIRKLLAKDDCRIDRICGCYVNGHKEIVTDMKEAFLSLPEEEMFKYCDILKKTLSGTVGKNLLTLEFPLPEEAAGGRQEFLLRLRDSELRDDGLVRQFCERFIETYAETENYLILLAHGVYDIPAKTRDEIDLIDASDYVYSFLICSICPVRPDKPGLCYDADSKSFVEKIQAQMVQMPDIGFLFPAFHDRNADIHSALYYSKNARMLHTEITDEILGASIPMPADLQKDTFNTIIEETLGAHCDFDAAKTIHENMNVLLEENKKDPEPAMIDKTDMRNLLEDCGATEEQMQHFNDTFEEETGGSSQLMASNLSGRTFEVKSDSVKIQISADRTDLIESRILDDGQEYICIPLTDDVEVNGIRIRSRQFQDKSEKTASGPNAS